MGKINFGRVLMGGIVAGLVIDVLSWLVDGVMLNSQWAAGNAKLGVPAFSSGQTVWFCVLGLIAGLIIIWFYAACKPRLGTRYRTALNVGLAIWIVAYVLPNAGFMYISGLYSHNLMVLSTLGNLVEVLVGTFIGAALYKESAVAAAVAPKAAAV
jgi:hypothetical protein